jgi:hypothetical protein
VFEFTVDTIVSAKPDDLFEVLMDFSGYKNWWVPQPTANTKNQSIIFFPLPFVRIKLQHESDKWGEKLTYRYIEGPFRGRGTWHISEITGVRKLRLTYHVVLTGTNLLSKIVLKTRAFQRKHKKDILRLTKNLENEVLRRKIT